MAVLEGLALYVVSGLVGALIVAVTMGTMGELNSYNSDYCESSTGHKYVRLAQQPCGLGDWEISEDKYYGRKR